MWLRLCARVAGPSSLQPAAPSQSRTYCLSKLGGLAPGRYWSAGQKRDESGVSTSSMSVSVPCSSRPNSNLVSAMIMPLVRAYSAQSLYMAIVAIVRGYLVGSGWKKYQKSGTVCGIQLSTGLKEADKLPEPIFTPSTKAAVGQHDENISFEQAAGLLGRDLAEKVKQATIAIYKDCAEDALPKGIIIADTKLEFGLDEQGTLTLIDEVLTPDSSRFWPADQYQPGANPPSFDKQYVRDWLEASGGDKESPAPQQPPDEVSR